MICCHRLCLALQLHCRACVDGSQYPRIALESNPRAADVHQTLDCCAADVHNRSRFHVSSRAASLYMSSQLSPFHRALASLAIMGVRSHVSVSSTLLLKLCCSGPYENTQQLPEARRPSHDIGLELSDYK